MTRKFVPTSPECKGGRMAFMAALRQAPPRSSYIMYTISFASVNWIPGQFITYLLMMLEVGTPA